MVGHLSLPWECRLITQGVDRVAQRGHLGLSFWTWEERGTWACIAGMEGSVSACLPLCRRGTSELEPGISGAFPDCCRPQLPCGWPRPQLPCGWPPRSADVRLSPRLGRSPRHREGVIIDVTCVIYCKMLAGGVLVLRSERRRQIYSSPSSNLMNPT